MIVCVPRLNLHSIVSDAKIDTLASSLHALRFVGSHSHWRSLALCVSLSRSFSPQLTRRSSQLPYYLRACPSARLLARAAAGLCAAARKWMIVRESRDGTGLGSVWGRLISLPDGQGGWTRYLIISLVLPFGPGRPTLQA